MLLLLLPAHGRLLRWVLHHLRLLHTCRRLARPLLRPLVVCRRRLRCRVLWSLVLLHARLLLRCRVLRSPLRLHARLLLWSLWLLHDRVRRPGVPSCHLRLRWPCIPAAPRPLLLLMLWCLLLRVLLRPPPRSILLRRGCGCWRRHCCHTRGRRRQPHPSG